MRFVSAFLLFVIFVITFFFGAYFHENDMARNFHKNGDAGAWFNEIKCPCMEEK